MTEPKLRTFTTGARRDSDADSTRYDLISPQGMERLAATYAEGAAKYDDHNWRKGMPFSVTANHAIRHLFKYLAGDTSEDHLAHAAWGLFALMEFEETHPDLDDRYFRPRVEETATGHECRFELACHCDRPLPPPDFPPGTETLCECGRRWRVVRKRGLGQFWVYLGIEVAVTQAGGGGFVADDTLRYVGEKPPLAEVLAFCNCCGRATTWTGMLAPHDTCDGKCGGVPRR